MALSQNKPKIGAAPMEQFQIINSSRDAVALIAGGNDDEVPVCDSAYNTLDRTLDSWCNS